VQGWILLIAALVVCALLLCIIAIYLALDTTAPRAEKFPVAGSDANAMTPVESSATPRARSTLAATLAPTPTPIPIPTMAIVTPLPTRIEPEAPLKPPYIFPTPIFIPTEPRFSPTRR
jgi:hypothetical protein